MRRAMASGSPATWSGKFRSTSVKPSHGGRSFDHLHHRRLAGEARPEQVRRGAEGVEAGGEAGKGHGILEPMLLTTFRIFVKLSTRKVTPRGGVVCCLEILAHVMAPLVVPRWQRADLFAGASREPGSFLRNSWRPPSGGTGPSKTASIGSLTSAFARTRAGCATAIRPGTWLCCARSRSTSLGPMARSKPASRASANLPPGTTTSWPR